VTWATVIEPRARHRRDTAAHGGVIPVTLPPGRSPDWLKMKNPAAPAVKREAEEDWS
jgi:hypothetical protein